MPVRLMVVLIAILASVPLGLAQPQVGPIMPKNGKGFGIFRDGVGQALKQRCVKCHGGEKVRGELESPRAICYSKVAAKDRL
ncbi:MAG: hypothetical protein CM1200mP29_09330 [Verrucomicrobiota bacterium]|nr:MAG: hypothetical protein CM1200mP29_09330 [Verrucomicrobiota bacterium]